MSEFESTSMEEEPKTGLEAIINEYFREDQEFFAGMDEDDRLGAVYGQLLENGEDPDEVMEKYKIFDVEV